MTALARLSFWVPSERLSDFDGVYRKLLLPLLEKHGLAESTERGRSTVEGVFSRLFAVEGPAQVVLKKEALRRDPVWQQALSKAAVSLGISSPDLPLQYRFGPYHLPAGPGKTVEIGSGLRQGLWQSFGVHDGLPLATIPAILQDRHGNLWFASDGNGVCRYDGAQATTFRVEDGLLSNTVSCMAEDRDGHLWFGTGRLKGEGLGVCRYDGEAFTTFSTEDGLAHDYLCAITLDHQGNLWFGTGGYGAGGKGVSRYDGDSLATFTTGDGLAHNTVFSIAEDRQGHLWFGTGGGGASRYDGKGFATFTAADGLAHDHIWAVVEDPQGKLWFGTARGVSRYDGTSFTSFTPAEGLPFDQVRSLAADRSGNIWLGSYGDGLSRYDGQSFTTFTTGDGLANNQVAALLEDRAGNLWAGTWSGVSCYHKAQFANFTSRDGLVGHFVFSILEDHRGDLWFGTSPGVSRYDGLEFTSLVHSDQLWGVWAMAEDRAGNLWFGTGRGILSYDGQTFTSHPLEGSAPVSTLALLCDRAGNLWFGTGGWGVEGVGLRRYNGKEWTRYTTRDGLASDWVGALLEDRQGRLWVGSREGLVSRWDGERFAPVGGLPSHLVKHMEEDRIGRLWLATYGGGVWYWDGHAFHRFAPGRALEPKQVTAITEDWEGHLWFGTYGGGVYIYDGQVLQTLSRKDGLVNDTVQHLLQDRRGDIWIATEGGLTRYRPMHLPPEVRLTELSADRRYGPVSELELPVSQKFVAFEFQGRSWTTHPDDMAYVYRLEGRDDAWRTTYGRRVEYQDLPLGEYVFQVQAVDRDLNYSEPATARLKIVPDPHLVALTQTLSGTAGEFVGESAALQQVQAQIQQVAATDLTVLILGETGTGKGLAARLLHRLSARAAGPFIQVNCGALPEGLVESELFGHERGAFTGAIARQIGKVELAEGGSLFLDEIGDLSPAAQAKLLQVLEERTFARVGGTATLRAQVRVIAATNRDLRQMVAQGTFREDLYFRLQGFQVELPPLRQRRADISVLASYFAARMAAHLNKKVTRLEPAAVAALRAYAWPGNVRELEHVVKRAVVVCAAEVIGPQDLFLATAPASAGPAETPLTLEEAERRHILQVLEQTAWIIKGPGGAASLLGVPTSTLYSRMKKLGIHRP